MTHRPHADLPLQELDVEFGDRPQAPSLAGADTSGHPQSQLPAIHRMYLMDISRIGALMQQVEAGLAAPSVLAESLRSLDLFDNMRRFGTLCGRECQVLSFHHDAEEHGIFPQLEAQGLAELTAVVARLRAEHEIVHELLIRLESAALALIREPGPESFAETRAIFDRLEQVIRSHFGYEETQLDAPIAQFIGRI